MWPSRLHSSGLFDLPRTLISNVIAWTDNQGHLPFWLCKLYLCSSKEKKYSHFIGEASWAGARIIQGQWTPEATSLYDLLILTFSENGKLTNLEALKSKAGLSDEEFEDVLQYSSQVLCVLTTTTPIKIIVASLVPHIAICISGADRLNLCPTLTGAI